MQAKIEKIVYPGKSMFHLDKKTTFTDEGLPDELIEYNLVKQKKNYNEAVTTAILEKSPDRVQPRCSHYKICSPYQYIDYQKQLKLKLSQFQEMFDRNLKTGLAQPPVITPSPDIWHYRNKTHLHIVWKDNTPYPAYHIRETHDEFIVIDQCFLIYEPINSLIKQLLPIIQKHNLKAIEEISIRQSRSTKEFFLTVHLNGQCDDDSLSVLPTQLNCNLAGIACINKNSARILSGKNHLTENIAGIEFSLGPLSFFQINVPLLETLIGDLTGALNLTGAETLADLYCGLGTFGLIFTRKVKQVTGVELSPYDLDFLRKNISKNGITNFRVCEGKSEKWMKKILQEKVNILLMDPPKKGIGKDICDAILKRPAERLVYISCDPSTLMRDLQYLLARYKITYLKLYDFFPHTPHMETCCVLERSGNNL